MEEPAPHVPHPWRGRVLVLIAATLWSTSGFFVKAPLFADWPGPVLAFWRALFAGLAMLPLVRRIGWSWGMLPMVACFAAMSYSYITSMSLMSGEAAGLALWLQNTAPGWVLLVGVLLGEKATWRDWVLVGCSVIGVVTIILFRTAQGAPLQAVGLGLFSGVAYAGIVLTLRRLRDFDSAWLAVLNQFGTVLALSPFLIEDASRADHLWPSPIQWATLATFGALQLGLPYYLFARAVRDIPGHEASVIALLEPLLLPVWIYLAYGPLPDPITYLGGGWIMAGLLIRYVKWRSTTIGRRPAAQSTKEQHDECEKLAGESRSAERPEPEPWDDTL